MPPVLPSPKSAAAATPFSEDEVVRKVREAVEQRRPIAPEGSGTKRHLGPAASLEATVLSLRRLDRVTAYEPGDMVVSVQAGVRLADLQRTLAQRKQWLPIDPPHAEATIGGILATGSAGPRRLGYGTAKDLLLGLRVAGPRGVVTKSGGRVVKNVTGYDLHKLHVGAFGSLGVLLEAHFKVHPRPEMAGAVVFACADLASAHALLLEVWGSALRPVALDLVSGSAAAAMRGALTTMPQAAAYAVVGIEGARSLFERHLRDLEDFRKRTLGLAVLRAVAVEALWNAFRDLPHPRREDVTVRIGARPRDLPALLAEAAPVGAGVHAHVGTGVARLYLAPPHDTAKLATDVTALHARASARGGYAVVETAPPALPGRQALPFTATPQDLGRRLKRAWDPDNLFNPGKMAF